MKRMAWVGLLSGMLIGHGALAQNSAATPPQPTPTPSTRAPSTQAQPTPTQSAQTPSAHPHNTQAPSTHPPQSAPKADPSAAPNTTGAPKTQQGNPAEKQKAYTGNTGKKNDPGTACSSARPTPNGGVNCGTTGDAATAGKVPK